MKVIGLGHYSRTGKDSFGNYFMDSMKEYEPKLKVGKKPFAWKLKQICFELYAWDGLREPEFYETKEGEPFRDIVLPTVGKTPVQIWIDMGTPAVRNNVYIDTWIDYLLKSNHGLDVLVIPDVRFPNEVEAIRALGGTLIKVVRPGYGPRKSVADRALLGFDGWDYIIGASGKMDELAAWGSKFACMYTGGVSPIQTNAERQAAKLAEVVEPWEPAVVTGPPVVDLQVNEAMASTLLAMNAVSAREGFPTLDDEYVNLLRKKFPHLPRTFREMVA